MFLRKHFQDVKSALFSRVCGHFGTAPPSSTPDGKNPIERDVKRMLCRFLVQIHSSLLAVVVKIGLNVLPSLLSLGNDVI